MKQYTTPGQTARLIELGFMPEMRIKGVCTKYGFVNVEHEAYFDVGKLIEIIDGKVSLGIDKLGASWMASVLIFEFIEAELIDCLYEACVKLKEAGVI